MLPATAEPAKRSADKAGEDDNGACKKSRQQKQESASVGSEDLSPEEVLSRAQAIAKEIERADAAVDDGEQHL